jgi:hypothetical protein
MAMDLTKFCITENWSSAIGLHRSYGLIDDGYFYLSTKSNLVSIVFRNLHDSFLFEAIEFWLFTSPFITVESRASKFFRNYFGI